MEFIPSSEMKCPKSGIFSKIIIGLGEFCKAMLQVSIAVLVQCCRNILKAKMAQPP